MLREALPVPSGQVKCPWYLVASVCRLYGACGMEFESFGGGDRRATIKSEWNLEAQQAAAQSSDFESVRHAQENNAHRRTTEYTTDHLRENAARGRGRALPAEGRAGRERHT